MALAFFLKVVFCLASTEPVSRPASIKVFGVCRWASAFTACRLLHAVQLAFPRTLPLRIRGAVFAPTLLLMTYASLKLVSYGYSK